MKRNEMLIALLEVMKEVFKKSDMNISETTELKDIDGWDSLLHMQLLVSIEKKFGIKFKLSELDRLTSVSEILNIIESKTE